jgi:S-formylglutathione hydrolase FrmB
VHPWENELSGRLETFWLDSEHLADNPLGDPAHRPVIVYLPPAYDAEPDRHFPTVYILQGLGGFVTIWTNRRPFELSVPEILDRYLAGPDAKPGILVYVDAWTSLGGSQFLDSPGTGRYHSYLCEEIVPAVDARYRTIADRNHRAVSGKSSGGYGALVNAMYRPDLFGALASHSGDTAFDFSMSGEIATAYRALRDRYDGDIVAFERELRGLPENGARPDHALVNVYACSACYSANGDGTIELPFDTRTGELREEVFARWLALDPVRMVAQYAEALMSMRTIYIDAGRSDQFLLDVGADILAARLAAAGITNVHFELFDGTHSGTEWRYPIGLAHVLEAISD